MGNKKSKIEHKFTNGANSKLEPTNQLHAAYYTLLNVRQANAFGLENYRTINVTDVEAKHPTSGV